MLEAQVKVDGDEARVCKMRRLRRNNRITNLRKKGGWWCGCGNWTSISGRPRKWTVKMTDV